MESISLSGDNRVAKSGLVINWFTRNPGKRRDTPRARRLRLHNLVREIAAEYGFGEELTFADRRLLFQTAMLAFQHERIQNDAVKKGVNTFALTKLTNEYRCMLRLLQQRAPKPQVAPPKPRWSLMRDGR